MSARHPHVVHVDEVTPATSSRGAYGFVRRQLGRAAGGQQLGCSLMEVPPGRSAWPRHAHSANEEAIFILEGRGLLALGQEQVEVGAGDYIALPAGLDAAHKLTCQGDAPLRYLCVSTMHPTDLAFYPDSGKIGVFGGAAPGGDAQGRFISGFFRQGDAVDYWEGELDGEGEG